MKINRAYCTELAPNNKQRTLLLKHAGTARFAYNWGLQRKNEVYAMNQLPVPHIKYQTAIDLHKELVARKKTDFSWMYEVSKCAPQVALRDLDKAFKNFFSGRTRYPRFKSRKSGVGSFGLTGDRIRISSNAIWMQKIGTIKLKEKSYLSMRGHVMSVRISERANRWFVSISVEEDIDIPVNSGSVVGVDLGIKTLATVSDGTIYLNPTVLSHYQRKLRRLQKGVIRKKKGSNNRLKSIQRFARTHMRVSNIRKDTIHKTTTELARTKSVIVVEDLKVRNMMKNHKIAGYLSDASFSEFRKQLEYKTLWYGSRLVVADRFYPSSKTCSHCGHVKKELLLSERVFECEVCHSKIDRDLNAAVNLSRLAVSSTESLNACLRRGVTDRSEMDCQCSSVIQELNANGRVS